MPVKMPSRAEWETIYKLVINWANDVPWKDWWQMIEEHYGFVDMDTEPDYEVVVKVVDGKRVPYLATKGDMPLEKHGRRLPYLDNTTYMYTEPPWEGLSSRPESP